LPADYHSIYANRGYQNTEFNPVKTWTEYTNRLLGVSIGLLIVLTAWASRRYWHVDRVITYIAGGVVLLVGFQGWLGSAVVASNLNPLMITCHMLLALLIVSLLIAAIARSQRELLAMLTTGVLPHRYRRVLYVAMAMTLLQVTMGTQVRESIDLIAHHHNYIDRQYWRDSFPVIFYVHRSFSSLILFTNLWLGWQLIKLPAASAVLRRVATVLVACVLTAILAGVSLDRLGFPAVAQPIHLLMANVIFGCQFSVLGCELSVVCIED
jgi:cytochrome c oxidase assembly protein subunit 15